MLIGTCLCDACSWSLERTLLSPKACSCIACRRYGAIWAYGHKVGDVQVRGPRNTFVRDDLSTPVLSFDTCKNCGTVFGLDGSHDRLGWEDEEVGQPPTGRPRDGCGYPASSPKGVS